MLSNIRCVIANIGLLLIFAVILGALLSALDFGMSLIDKGDYLNGGTLVLFVFGVFVSVVYSLNK